MVEPSGEAALLNLPLAKLYVSRSGSYLASFLCLCPKLPNHMIATVIARYIFVKRLEAARESGL